ncbi:MAG TPA: integrase core domain-containing protein [Sumerlaeia bacterium]|nr:integrase core domain-containing protein [Sumerlaeia bacterium]
MLHIRVTPDPTATWTAQQIREAFPFDVAPRYLLHDNDAIYGREFSRAVKNMGIKEVRTAKRAPWQSPYVERMIGSIRRECSDHVIPLSERHLEMVLTNCQRHYNGSRTHLGLAKDSPEPGEVEPPEKGAEIVAISHLGGLHHCYTRKAA